MENLWTALPKRSPYVLPMDRAAVEAHADSSQVRKYPEKYCLHTELLPTPFIGDPSAPIVLLSRNPSFHPKDEKNYEESEFRSAAMQNLKHKVPFFTIDSRFRHTASYRWWHSKLKMIEDTDEETVARGVFCVPGFPLSLPKRLPVEDSGSVLAGIHE